MQIRNYEKIAVAFKRIAQERNLCMACERPFASAQERTAFLAKQVGGWVGWCVYVCAGTGCEAGGLGACAPC